MIAVVMSLSDEESECSIAKEFRRLVPTVDLRFGCCGGSLSRAASPALWNGISWRRLAERVHNYM